MMTDRDRSERWLGRTGRAALCAALLLAVGVACEEDDDGYDHTPAPGLGALVVENDCPNDVAVYVDGVFLDDVDDDHWQAFDLLPGLHRLVLVEEDTERAYGDDIDVLDGRRTIIEVDAGGYAWDDLWVNTYIE